MRRHATAAPHVIAHMSNDAIPSPNVATTPFHDRVGAANQTSLWSHWSGYLVVDKYQMAEKFEYVAIRNAAGLFDTSPLHKYRIAGPDAGAVPVVHVDAQTSERAARARRSTPSGATTTATSTRMASSFDTGPTTSSSLRPSRTCPTCRTSSAATGSRSATSARFGSARGPGPAQSHNPRRAGAGDRVARLLRTRDRQDRQRARHGGAVRLHRRPGLRGAGRA